MNEAQIEYLFQLLQTLNWNLEVLIKQLDKQNDGPK